MVIRPSVFDGDIASFGIAGLAEPAVKRGDHPGESARRLAVQKADDRKGRLRVRYRGPRSRDAGKDSDHIAPSQSRCPMPESGAIPPAASCPDLERAVVAEDPQGLQLPM